MVEPDRQRIGCLPELVEGASGRIAFAQTAGTYGGNSLQRFVENAAQLGWVGECGVKLVSLNCPRCAVGKRALEPHHEPAPEECRRGVRAFRRLVS